MLSYTMFTNVTHSSLTEEQYETFRLANANVKVTTAKFLEILKNFNQISKKEAESVELLLAGIVFMQEDLIVSNKVLQKLVNLIVGKGEAAKVRTEEDLNKYLLYDLELTKEVLSYVEEHFGIESI